MVYITAVHMENGNEHEHIASVRWRNPTDAQTGQNTRQEMVDWIRKGGVGKVKDGNADVDVGVVDANPPYIRTHADGKWTNNLLALPRF